MARKIDYSTNIDNQKSQYDSILSNIRIANSELEIAISNKNKSKEGLVELIKEQKTASQEVEKLLQIRHATNLEIDNKTQKLEDDISKFNTYKDETNEEIEEKLLSSEKEIRKAGNILNDVNSKIDKKTNDHNLLSDKVDVLTKDLLEKQEQLKDISKQYNDINQKLQETAQEAERQENLMSIEIKKTSVMIEGLREELDDTKNIKEAFIKNLEEREKKLIIKEADADVIIRRIKKIWKELYPERELKI